MGLGLRFQDFYENWRFLEKIFKNLKKKYLEIFYLNQLQSEVGNRDWNPDDPDRIPNFGISNADQCNERKSFVKDVCKTIYSNQLSFLKLIISFINFAF